MITADLPLAAIIAGTTAVALWLAHRFGWASRMSSTLLVILFGAVLSNLGLVAAASPVYGLVTGPVTSLAIVWLLLAVDLRDLRAAGPRMLGAFALAVGATVAGAMAAALAFAGAFPDTVWKLAGVMTGTYSGGGLNFVAVGRELELPESLYVAAAASDNVVTALWMAATLLAPALLGRWFPRPAPGPASGDEPAVRSLDPLRQAAPLRPLDMALLLAIGLVLLVAAEAAAARLPAVPAVLWLTSFALAAGQLPAVRRLSGSLQLGTFALHLFFAVLGIACRVEEILVVGLAVFWFTALVVAIHGLLVFAGARLAGLDVETTAVASQAAVGGPSTAMALAVTWRRSELVLPSVAVGLLGYAVGNYAGLAVAYFVRAGL